MVKKTKTAPAAAKAEPVGNRKVKFLRDYVVDDGLIGTGDETRFKTGQVKSLPDRSAQHFISRGVAAEV